MTTATLNATFAPAHETSAEGRAVKGGPRALLRLEGAAVLLLSVAAYAHLAGGWGLFAALFLVPDLAFLGYLAGARAGAAAYNATHSYLGPALLGAASFALAPALLPVALIWTAHVGFDRMLGYGLKYASAFGDTHLGRVGRRSAR
jgi:hypothetical protein